MNNITISLDELVGTHVLSGVSQCLTAPKGIEDPIDGYRSCMNQLIICPRKTEKIINMFEPINVICKMRKDDSSNCSEILEILDAQNGEIILSVGTEYTDTYYPCFIAEWTPENIHSLEK